MLNSHSSCLVSLYFITFFVTQTFNYLTFNILLPLGLVMISLNISNHHTHALLNNVIDISKLFFGFIIVIKIRKVIDLCVFDFITLDKFAIAFL